MRYDPKTGRWNKLTNFYSTRTLDGVDRFEFPELPPELSRAELEAAERAWAKGDDNA